MNKGAMFLAMSLMSYPLSLAHSQCMGPIEYNVDRPGSDYVDFSLPSANPTVCLSQCAADPQCMAWNYEPPGVTFTEAHCWLKNGVPWPTFHPGLRSGVKVK